MRRTVQGQRCRARRQVSSFEDTGWKFMMFMTMMQIYKERVRRNQSVGARLLTTAHVYYSRDIVNVIYVISCTGDYDRT